LAAVSDESGKAWIRKRKEFWIARIPQVRRPLFMRWVTIAVAMTGLLAQSPITPKEFDVISVKPSAPDDRNGVMMQTLPRGIRFSGVPLRLIIMAAYEVKAFQISGGPDWIKTERWDVVATEGGGEGRLTIEQKRPMMQALMAGRFALKTHSETKELPVYALMVDKKGAKLAAHTGAEQQVGNGNGSLRAKKIGMTWLAEWLSRKLGRVVIDQTDLKEEYDFALEWSPEPGEGDPEYTGMPPGTPPPHVGKDGPSIFTALREQLGLRLISQKGQVKVIVIDSVERPSAN
jgi:bla regulator protein blaR1